MKTHEEYELAARISKSKGLKGEIVVVGPDGLPLRLYEGLEVWVVPPLLEGVRHTTVTSMQAQAKGYVATLEGVEHIDAARSLVGRSLLARAHDLESIDFADLDPESFEAIERSCVGCLVTDEEHGVLGFVVRVERNPAHPLLVVAAEEASVVEAVDGEGGEYQLEGQVAREVLIPYVDEFIVARGDTMIETRLPSGLLELNR